MALLGPFFVFTALAFIVLLLTFRLRWRTLLVLSVVLGFLGDLVVDLARAWMR
jgi:hypothetical protein